MSMETEQLVRKMKQVREAVENDLNLAIKIRLCRTPEELRDVALGAVDRVAENGSMLEDES